MHTLATARWTLRLDGAFLLIVGLLAMGLEARGHFLASGPLAHLAGSPYAIGGFEAHGLAAILGVQLLVHARDPMPRRWHLLGLAVHLLLGSCNLLFWPSFAALGMLAMGVATTACHLGFVAAHAALALRPRGLRPAAM